MSNIKISELTEVSQIATGDYFPFLDVSDTAQAASGSTRKIKFSSISPFTYLLKPTGSNDNVAIQSALDYLNTNGGGTLYLSPSSINYDITAAITLYANVSIIGGGWGKTVLKLNSSYSPSDVFSIGSNGGTSSGTASPAGTYANITLADFEVNFNGIASAIAFYAPKNLNIENLYLHDTANYGLYIANGDYVWVKNCRIENLTGTGTQAGIQFKGVQHGWAINNRIYNSHGGSGTQGIDSHATDGTYARDGKYNHYIGNDIELCSQGLNCEDYDTVIIGNTIKDSYTQYGIGVRNAPSNILIANNIIDGVGAANAVNGIDLFNTTSGCKDIKIYNNIINNINGTTSSHGIYIGANAANTEVKGNTVKNSGARGIYVRTSNTLVQNNYLYDDQGTATQTEGIGLDTNVSNCQVVGNRCVNNVSAGIRLIGANTDNIIQGNHLEGGLRGILCNGSNNNTNNLILGNKFKSNSTAALTFTGAGIGSGTIIRNNLGYVTEASGTATINNGSTSTTITHGLSVTPTLKDIGVTLGENPTNTAGDVYVTSITSTQFTVNVRNDPGASNLDIAWRVLVL